MLSLSGLSSCVRLRVFYFRAGGEEFLHPGSGTFAHDFKQERLLYAPVDPGAAPGSTVVPRLTELVRADAAHDVTLDSLTFQHAGIDFSGCFRQNSFCEFQSAAHQSSAALHWKNAERLALLNLTVRHTGGYGLWFDTGTRDSTVSASHFHDLGGGGVRMTAAHNISLADSVLEDGGLIWRSASAVLMQTANVSLVTHNLIRKFYYTGISVGWSWGFASTPNFGSVISANEIHTIGQGELSDLGCIYHLGIDPGTIIEDNSCHDVVSYNYGGW